MRAVGFVHSPPSAGLLPPARAGTEYRGLVHVSDWLPTLLHVAGADPAALAPGIDGVNVWPAIAEGALPSPRAEILHGIDVVGGLGPSGFGNAAIRVGGLKLLVGQPGVAASSGWAPPPGCGTDAAQGGVCAPPRLPAGAGCSPDDKDTHTCEL
jgi:hypothetical protein